MNVSEVKSIDPIIEMVKRLFFPRWDPQRKWRFAIEEIPIPASLSPDFQKIHGESLGCCEPTEKTIYINPGCDLGYLWVVLIHEICHAVGGGTHIGKWLERMKKAHKKLGEFVRDPPAGSPKELWKMIYENIELQIEGTPTELIVGIQNLFEDPPSVMPTLDHVISVFSKAFRCNKKAVFKKYPTIEKVYKEERRRFLDKLKSKYEAAKKGDLNDQEED